MKCTTSRLLHQVRWSPAKLTHQSYDFTRVLFVVADVEHNENLSRYQAQLTKEGYESAVIEDAARLGPFLGQETIIVHLPQAPTSPSGIYDAAIKSCNSLVTVAQTLKNHTQNIKDVSYKLFSLVSLANDRNDLAYAPLHGLARVLRMEIPDLFSGLFEDEEGVFPTSAFHHAQNFDYVKVWNGVPHTAALQPLPNEVLDKTRMDISQKGSYLITGGTSGLGLELANWMAERGAGHIILVSRSGLSAHSERSEDNEQNSLRERIAALESQGTQVHVLQVDCSKQDSEARLIEEIGELHAPPVRGVVHAAGVAEYNTIDRCQPSDIANVLAPKLVGALALDNMFPPGELDFFILISSFGQLVGFPGQLSYGPANAFLDELATQRRRKKDNSTSIQWTCWRGIGLMAQNAAATRMITKGMTARGFKDVSKAEALQAFDTIISNLDAGQVAVVRALELEANEPLRHPMLEHITPRSRGKEGPTTLAPINYPDHAIAVVGMACRTAAGDTADDLWQVVSTGKTLAKELDEQRFPGAQKQKGKTLGNFIKDIDSFDHRFFKKSKREAAALDPHQRLLLETTYHALESAGEFGGGQQQPPESHDIADGGRVTGCFIGMNAPDYPLNLACNPLSPYTGFGMLRSFVSGRLSHYFGWTGPSHAIDTACSSAMVAIHQACRAIQARECNRAVAGGVNLMTNDALFNALRTGGFLSDQGPCSTFDERASGYCRGEAVGVVILKPLKDAFESGDDIKGVLMATGNNQNINNTSITNPVLESQTALYRNVLSRAGVEPKDVSYVECHGTATKAGDPVEVQGIRQVLSGESRDTVLHIGAVKPNIGHAEGASGVISLIKVLLMMQHGKISPQANFQKLNPDIAVLEPARMAIPTKLQPWSDDLRLALVNNYGASGNNAAALVAPPPTPQTPSISAATGATFPVFISAASESSLSRYCGKLKALLEGTPLEVCDLAFSLAVKQNRRLRYIFSTTVTTVSDLAAQLREPVKYFDAVPDQKPIVLLFSGQNGNAHFSAQSFYQGSILFQSHLHRCDEAMQSLGHPSMFPAIIEGIGEDANLILRHGALFSIQYSCAMAWIDCGVKPPAICGHSFGEWAALTVSGALTLEGGMQLVTGRASLIHKFWGEDTGAMIAIEDDFLGSGGTPSRYLKPFRAKYQSATVDIACYNGANNYVFAGGTEDIHLLESFLAEEKSNRPKLQFKVLHGMHAFHSHLADSIVEESAQLSASVSFQSPTLPFESCHEDSWNGPGENVIARNTREPVYFARAISRIVDRLGPCTFLEAGMGGPIIAMAQNAITKGLKRHSFVAINNKDPMQSLAHATVNLWKNGQPAIQFWPFHKSQRSSYLPVTLPQYQFEKTSHWLEYKSETIDKSEKEQVSTSSGLCPNCLANDIPYIVMDKSERQEKSKFVYCVNPHSSRYNDLVAGHTVAGTPICPAAMYLELAAHAVSLLPEVQKMYVMPGIGIEGLEIKAPLGVDKERAIRLTLTAKSEGSWSFELASTKAEGKPLKHATGIVSLQRNESQVELDEPNTWAHLLQLRDDPDSEALRGSMIYKVFSTMAKYSSPYEGLRQLVGKGDEAMGDISMSSAAMDLIARSPNDNIADPVIMDNFLQVPGAFVHSLRLTPDEETDGSMSYICVGMGPVKPLNRLPGNGKYRAYAKVNHADNKLISLNVFAFDEGTKKMVWSARDLKFSKIPRNSLVKALAAANPTDLDIAPQSEKPRKPTVQETAADDGSRDPSDTSSMQETKATNPRPDVTGNVQALLSRSLDVPVEDISKEATLEDLGIDSLVSGEIIASISDELKVDISTEDFANVVDVAGLCDLVLSHMSGETLETSEDSREDPWKSVVDVLSESLHVPAEEIKPDSKLEDLGVDSIVAQEIIQGLQKVFDLEIKLDDFASAEDVTSICALLRGPSDTTPPFPLSEDSTPASAAGTSTGATSRTSFSEIGSGSEGFDSPTLQKHLSIHSAFQSIRGNFDAHAQETNLSGYWKEIHPQQTTVVTAFILEAFAQLGCRVADFEPGERLPPLPETLDKYHREVPRLWEILQDAGFVEKQGDCYVRGEQPVPSRSAKSLSAELINAFPAFASTHGLPDHLGPHLADSLTGKANPVSLLFGSPRGRSLLEDFYANGPDLHACTKVLCDFVRAAMQTQGRDGIEAFRVLEIGAGTGGTTKHLLPLLQAAGIPFEYTFTELSGSMLSKAKNSIFKGVPSMQFRKLDIEKEAPPELLGRYHLVVSSNCVHATRDLKVSMANIRRLVREEDGCVALVELTQKLPWYDLVWGLLDGWWLFEDGREYALQSPWAWEKVMREAGFGYVDWSEGQSQESRGVRVICGMAGEPPGDELLVRATSSLLHRASSKSSAGTNVFLLPDGFGYGAVFGSLQESLREAEDVSVHSLNSPFLKGQYDRDEPPSVEELAGYYVAEIKRRQARGPYILGGYSFGGLAAYEAVRQLLENGDEVEKLILIDTACPGEDNNSMSDSLVDFLDSINGEATASSPDNKDHSPSRLARSSPIRSEHFTLARRQLAMYRASKLPPCRKMPQVTLLSAISGVDKQDAVPRPEVPPEEEGIVKWFLDDREDGPLGWEELLGDVKVSRVSGDHFSMMGPKMVKAWGEEFVRVLES